ncbi:hypothetical protein [Pseudalkalibacillus decolorationis]|uniref:hypothetical protein n=1 Tax=Pseudalkalibacillus decolorationis TaxID=163879 RepID=UPI00214980CD|nr:hypothetical protein [Pseudalkalibacillus decolorationis]
MKNQPKRKTVEIEHPTIREVDERTIHPGVKEEQEQQLMETNYNDKNEENRSVQG